MGGGSAGFMTSSLLARYKELSGLDFDIKLVYNENIDTIGVGESTLHNFRIFMEALGLKDKDWMSECDATYKVGIAFQDFYKKGRHFYYPFGNIDPRKNTPEGINQWFMVQGYFPEICTVERSSHYFLPTYSSLMDGNKLCEEKYDFSLFGSSYHFDSALLGKFLRRYSEERGVEVINDNFYGVAPNEDGSIRSLVCDKDVYSADLFVDCSGFKSLLLGEMMKGEWIPYDNTLLNNKAIVTRIDYKNKEEELKNYTKCTALDNGWVWEIPLWNQLSIGYAHTNRFASEEEIKTEFLTFCKEKYDVDVSNDCRIIEFKTGRYKKGWIKNVVAVGLSYGFIEPLESTGIATMIVNAFRLVECLSKRDMNIGKIERELFNYSVSRNIDDLRCFVEMHYYLSPRDDSDYWKYIKDEIDFRNDISSEYSYETFLENTTIERSYYQDNNGAPGGLFIAAGMGYTPYSKAILLTENQDQSTQDAMKNDLKDFEMLIERLAEEGKELSSSYKFLEDNIYNI